ncbi:MAG: hypothetical protein OEX97_05000 [Acidimicrobiia bacterium]|nr:hypothetical protein [Acidimicrobiia bacterium]
MNLDQRARQAAEGIKSNVSGHPLLMMNATPAQVPLVSRMLSFAGAFALVAIVGFMMVQTNMFASDSDETAETAPPTTVIVTTTTAPIETIAPAVPSEGGSEAPAEPIGEDPVVEPVDSIAPDLVITAPIDGDRLKETAVVFAGTTEPGATVMAGPYQATVTDDGSWSIVLILGEGGNRARFTATDEAGNVSEASIVVYYDPPVTTTKPTSEWGYTAHATYGECALAPPYDEYYGTAAPGTTILVLSDYGSGSTVADGDGNWWVRVEFPTAPTGKAFVVKVKNETTYEKFTFEFVSLAG